MYKSYNILILKHIYDKNVLIYDTCYNMISVNYHKPIYLKFIKCFNVDASYYVWDWMDNI